MNFGVFRNSLSFSSHKYCIAQVKSSQKGIFIVNVYQEYIQLAVFLLGEVLTFSELRTLSALLIMIMCLSIEHLFKLRNSNLITLG